MGTGLLPSCMNTSFLQEDLLWLSVAATIGMKSRRLVNGWLIVLAYCELSQEELTIRIRAAGGIGCEYALNAMTRMSGEIELSNGVHLDRSRSWQSGVTDGSPFRELWDSAEVISLEWEALANARVNRGMHAPGNAHIGRQGGNLPLPCREYAAERHSRRDRPEPVGGIAGNHPARRAAGIPCAPCR